MIRVCEIVGPSSFSVSVVSAYEIVNANDA